jgi:hypothetical protein
MQLAYTALNMGGMHRFTREDIDVEAIRQRLRGMSDEKLREYGRAAAWMVDPAAQRGQVRDTYRVQLAEARAEWRRRSMLEDSGRTGAGVEGLQGTTENG